jgi:hypothetical protein
MSEQLHPVARPINTMWPPTLASNDRLKGFYHRVVDSCDEAHEFSDMLSTYEALYFESGVCTKISMRAVASLGAISTLDEIGVTLEGALPIRGHNDLFVLYAAANRPSRRASDKQLLEQGNLLKTITSQPPADRTHHELEARILGDSSSKVCGDTMLGEFTSLYKVFGYTKEQVADIVHDPNNTIAYLSDENGVVSTSLAERTSVAIQDFGILEMIEITDAVTRRNARGQGHYRRISGFLLDHLLERDAGTLSVLHGENNLAMPYGLHAAHKNGRRFNYFDRERVAVNQPGFGILQQNFHIADSAETRRYNDFALSYVNLGEV